MSKIIEGALIDAVIFGTGFFYVGMNGVKCVKYSQTLSKFSFGLSYLDDWRELVIFLREKNEQNNRKR